MAATTGYPDSGPYKQGLAYPDPVGGTHGAAAALGAWSQHQETGEAVHVDLSQLETLLSIAGDQIIEFGSDHVFDCVTVVVDQRQQTGK